MSFHFRFKAIIHKFGNAVINSLQINDQPTVADVSLEDGEELFGINSIIGQLVAFDLDVTDTHTFFAVKDSLRVNGIAMENVTFTLNLDGTFEVTGDFNHLAEGENAIISFDYYAVDNGSWLGEDNQSLPETVTITITGTNDQPVVTDVAVTATESHAPETIYTGQLEAKDLDATDTHTFQLIDNSATVVTNGGSSAVITDLAVMINADGSYMVNGNFDALAEGETATVTFQYTATDDSGTASATSEAKTVTLTVTGTNDAAIVSSDMVILDETNAVLTASGVLTSSDVDNEDNAFIAQANVAGTNGTFSITADGAWTYTANSALNELNLGDSITETFSVQSIDGTESTVAVTINGTADIANAEYTTYAVQYKSGETTVYYNIFGTTTLHHYEVINTYSNTSIDWATGKEYVQTDTNVTTYDANGNKLEYNNKSSTTENGLLYYRGSYSETYSADGTKHTESQGGYLWHDGDTGDIYAQTSIFSYTFDANGNLIDEDSGQIDTLNDTVVYQLSYETTHDADGAIIGYTKIESWSPDENKSYTSTQYDAEWRILASDSEYTNLDPYTGEVRAITRAYTYDASGNIISQSGTEAYDGVVGATWNQTIEPIYNIDGVLAGYESIDTTYYTYGSAQYVHTYDTAMNRLTYSSTENGMTTTFDNSGNIISVSVDTASMGDGITEGDYTIYSAESSMHYWNSATKYYFTTDADGTEVLHHYEKLLSTETRSIDGIRENITLNIYDAAGNQIGSTMTETLNGIIVSTFSNSKEPTYDADGVLTGYIQTGEGYNQDGVSSYVQSYDTDMNILSWSSTRNGMTTTRDVDGRISVSVDTSSMGVCITEGEYTVYSVEQSGYDGKNWTNTTKYYFTTTDGIETLHHHEVSKSYISTSIRATGEEVVHEDITTYTTYNTDGHKFIQSNEQIETINGVEIWKQYSSNEPTYDSDGVYTGRIFTQGGSSAGGISNNIYTYGVDGTLITRSHELNGKTTTYDSAGNVIDVSIDLSAMGAGVAFDNYVAYTLQYGTEETTLYGTGKTTYYYTAETGTLLRYESSGNQESMWSDADTGDRGTASYSYLNIYDANGNPIGYSRDSQSFTMDTEGLLKVSFIDAYAELPTFDVDGNITGRITTSKWLNESGSSTSTLVVDLDGTVISHNYDYDYTQENTNGIEHYTSNVIQSYSMDQYGNVNSNNMNEDRFADGVVLQASKSLSNYTYSNENGTLITYRTDVQESYTRENGNMKYVTIYENDNMLSYSVTNNGRTVTYDGNMNIVDVSVDTFTMGAGVNEGEYTTYSIEHSGHSNDGYGIYDWTRATKYYFTMDVDGTEALHHYEKIYTYTDLHAGNATGMQIEIYMYDSAGNQIGYSDDWTATSQNGDTMNHLYSTTPTFSGSTITGYTVIYQVNNYGRGEDKVTTYDQDWNMLSHSEAFNGRTVTYDSSMNVVDVSVDTSTMGAGVNEGEYTVYSVEYSGDDFNDPTLHYNVTTKYYLTSETGSLHHYEVSTTQTDIYFDGSSYNEVTSTSTTITTYDAVGNILDNSQGYTTSDTMNFMDALTLMTDTSIDFSSIGDIIHNVEAIDLSQNGANSLSNLTVQDVFDMTDSTKTLLIFGDSADSVTLLNPTDADANHMWTQTADNVIENGRTLDIYHSGDSTVTLKIEDSIAHTVI